MAGEAYIRVFPFGQHSVELVGFGPGRSPTTVAVPDIHLDHNNCAASLETQSDKRLVGQVGYAEPLAQGAVNVLVVIFEDGVFMVAFDCPQDTVLDRLEYVRRPLKLLMQNVAELFSRTICVALNYPVGQTIHIKPLHVLWLDGIGYVAPQNGVGVWIGRNSTDSAAQSGLGTVGRANMGITERVKLKYV